MQLVTAQNVSKLYSNNQGLKAASFSVQKGEFVGVVGQSGVGKTTLMRLLSGAVFPTAGELHVLDTNMAEIRRAELRGLRRRIATVYQNYNVVPCLSVSQNVILGRMSRIGWYEAVRRLVFPSQQETEEIREILFNLQIEGKMNERCQELSGGQQQRVAIARALYSQAELFLVDEPIASVDPSTANLILNTFQILKQQGCTIVMNLHQLDHAIKYCDRILMLEQGQVAFDGTPEQFLETKEYGRLVNFDMSERRSCSND